MEDREVNEFAKLAIRTGYAFNSVSEDTIDRFIEALGDIKPDGKDNLRTILDSDEFLTARRNYKENLVKPREIYRYIQEYIPTCARILEIGCGDGGMGKVIQQNKSGIKYTGTEITEGEFLRPSENYRIIQQLSETELQVEGGSMDVVLMIDMIHHTRYDKQADLLKNAMRKLDVGGSLVLFEFSFPQDMEPVLGNDMTKRFSELSILQRFNYMYFIDWLGNTVVAGSKMPMPDAYRTTEEWEDLIVDCGLNILSSRYIGFPESFFHQGPYSLFVVKKDGVS